jgi:replication factor C small subunit
MKKRHIEEVLFTEKYRPLSIDDMILPDRFRKRFENGFSDFPRILLYSDSPGTGKTTLAKILVSEFKHPYLYINASKDSSVDVLREQVSDFCSKHSLHTIKNDRMKIVIFDEIDGASIQFFKALRGFMQDYKHVGFIATCNYLNKVPQAIQSRFDNINFTFTEKDQEALKYEYAKRLLMVSKKEGIKLNGDAIETIIPKFFPDLRSMLNLLQSFKSEGKLELSEEDIKNSYSLFDNLFELVFQKDSPEEIYKVIMEQYGNKVETVMNAFYNDFPKYVAKEKPDYVNMIPSFVIKVGEWQYRKSFIIDPPLAPMSMMYEIQQMINKKG